MFQGLTIGRPLRNWMAAASLFLLTLAGASLSGPSATHIDSIDRAHAVLIKQDTATTVLGLMHFGQKYHDHNYVKTIF